MSVIIILGDPHIGKGVNIGKVGLGSALNSRIIDQINLLDWTLEQAINHGADHIIITGDVFEDPKPSPSLITLFISWLKKTELIGIQVHIIVGNHDILRTGNFYTSPLDIISECDLENIFIYREINTIFIDEVAVTLIPFRDRKSYNVDSNPEALSLLNDSLVYELASIPLVFSKVVVGHLALEGSIPVGDEIDDLTNELFCPINMFSGYDYVWMGHVHKPQVMNKKPYMAHIGSMDISNFGETDHAKHIVVIDSEEITKFKQVTLPTRQLKKISISIPKDTKDTTEFVIELLKNDAAELAKAIVKLEIHLISPELISINRLEIEKFLYKQGVFYVSGISESKKMAPIKKDSTASIDNSIDVVAAIKIFAKTHVEKEKQTLYIELATDIYNDLKNQGE